MSTYRIDGTILRTENASQTWYEARRHDGRNFISVATGSQWKHETLHRSRRGRYWLECTSDSQGSTPHAEWISEHEATRWLLQNEYELPEDLEQYREDIEE